VTYGVVDASGNAVAASSSVSVPLTRNGLADPLSLTVAGNSRGTVLQWNQVPDALFYNAIRGRLADIREQARVINLGSVVCLEHRSTDETTYLF
jgi:hypothetical protein